MFWSRKVFFLLFSSQSNLQGKAERMRRIIICNNSFEQFGVIPNLVSYTKSVYNCEQVPHDPYITEKKTRFELSKNIC